LTDFAGKLVVDKKKNDKINTLEMFERCEKSPRPIKGIIIDTSYRYRPTGNFFNLLK
jgi:hypothetical protein